jgi:ABC-type sugar transport system substrate-binding protein
MAMVLLEGVASARADAAAAEMEAEALQEALRRARADRARVAATATEEETSSATTQVGDDSDEERFGRQAAACRLGDGPAPPALVGSERPPGRDDHLAAARRLLQRADPLDHNMGEMAAPALR